MLISFEVTNFRSIRAGQTLSLVKASGNELEETNTFDMQGVSQLTLLRSAAIYGPNASGKSNLLRAIGTMKRIVLESAVDKRRGDLLPVTPFLLDPETRGAPSEFEVNFLVDGIRYQYGFSATEERIQDEWLFAFPKVRPQRWFERYWNEEKQCHDWELGANLLGEKLLWQKSTRDNALFLSTAVQLNSGQLQPLFDWFRRTLRTNSLGVVTPNSTARMYEDLGHTGLLEYLRAADLGIDDIQIERKPFDPSQLPKDLPDELKAVIIERAGNRTNLEVRTVHIGSDGQFVSFDLNEESDGTKKMFAFAGPWLDALASGSVLFVDELHDNLHPKLVQFLVGLFQDNITNPKNAQLVFTTHETSILSQDVFRRDQVWFCEKDQQQATQVFPLTDFSPRKGRENLELSYLSGRYGALPFVRRLSDQPGTGSSCSDGNENG